MLFDPLALFHEPLGLLDTSGKKIVDLADPDPGLVEHFALEEPLFRRPPQIEDIQQNQFADCFLLAPLLAVLGLPGGPRYIEGMMREEPGSLWSWTKVVVRFFDPRSSQVLYLRVRKSAPLQVGGRGPDRSAVWVKIFEKAWAAMHGGYKALHFGKAADVLAAILGANTLSVNLQQGEAESYMKFCHLYAANPIAVQFPPIAEVLREVFRDGPFIVGEELKQNWLTWNQGKDDLWMGLLRAHPFLLRVEHVQAFLVEHSAGLMSETREAVLRWLEQGGPDRTAILPGKRGTGIYTREQLALFDRIRNTLAARQPVVVSSNKSVGKNPSGVGLGGELKVKGLAGQHEYAVLACRTFGSVRQVQLANPWGRYGRTYDWKLKDLKIVMTAQASEGDNEFWLELTDLTKRFERVYLGGLELPIH